MRLDWTGVSVIAVAMDTVVCLSCPQWSWEGFMGSEVWVSIIQTFPFVTKEKDDAYRDEKAEWEDKRDVALWSASYSWWRELVENREDKT